MNVTPNVRNVPAQFAGRLYEYFDDGASWPRRAWNPGSVMALREVHSVIQWSGMKVLSPATATWLARDVERTLGRDRGIGDREIRQQLTNALRARAVSGNHAHRGLARLTDLIEERYLSRWADAARSDQPPTVERMSRAVATHLLDAGYDPEFLRGWLAPLQSLDPAEIAEAAHALAAEPEYEWSVLVPFTSIPSMDGNRESAPGWVPPAAVPAWLSEHGVRSSVRHNGGFVFNVKAHDPYSAVARVSEIVDRMLARAKYSRKRVDLEATGSAIVAHHGELALPQRRRQVHVLSLLTERRLYDAASNSVMDAALELAAPLNDGAPGPAISGGWAAVESLLLTAVDESDGGRGVLAADRMAALIACSLPRAELTSLSYRHRPEAPDRTALELDRAIINRDRSRVVAATLQSGGSLALDRSRDRAAEHRVRRLLADPRRRLRDVERQFQSVTRRLYRHRNLLMHGGAVDVLTLTMTLRTVAPLLGAGLDRLAHAHLTAGLEPLDLAARARTSLDLVGTADGREVFDLLE